MEEDTVSLLQWKMMYEQQFGTVVGINLVTDVCIVENCFFTMWEKEK